MAACPGHTVQMKTLFHGWPIMVHDTHTRRRRRMDWYTYTPVRSSSYVKTHIFGCVAHSESAAWRRPLSDNNTHSRRHRHHHSYSFIRGCHTQPMKYVCVSEYFFTAEHVRCRGGDYRRCSITWSKTCDLAKFCSTRMTTAVNKLYDVSGDCRIYQ